MVHSVELVFDPDTEAAVRHIWDGLQRRGRAESGGAPASRPHVTLTVAEQIDPDVDDLLADARRFPIAVRVGAPLLFGVEGRRHRASGRAVGGTALRCRPKCTAVPAASAPGPMAHTLPGPVDAARDAGRRRCPRPTAPALLDVHRASDEISPANSRRCGAGTATAHEHDSPAVVIVGSSAATR